MDTILNYEPDFTHSEFKSYVDNIFVQIHLALMTKNLEKIRHFVNDEVYSIYVEKLNELNTRGLTQMYDEMNVKETILMGSEVVNDKMQITVKIISRYMDYRIDKNGNFVDGINDHRVEKENHLIFEKKINSMKQENVRKCPGCGASIDVNANGVCAYCGTVYNLSDKNWVLVAINTF